MSNITLSSVFIVSAMPTGIKIAKVSFVTKGREMIESTQGVDLLNEKVHFY